MRNQSASWVAVAAAACVLACSVAPAQAHEAMRWNKIAEEAFIYGFPLVMNYTVFYEYFIDKSGREYKVPPNQL